MTLLTTNHNYEEYISTRTEQIENWLLTMEKAANYHLPGEMI